MDVVPTTVSHSENSPARVLDLRVLLIVSVLVLPWVLALAMNRGLNHDEHQHVAAGALVGRAGLLPYRDFPHFHTPYLAYIYAALFFATDHLVLAARLWSVACTSLIVGLLGSLAYALFRDRGRGWAAGVCACAVVLCLSSQVFRSTVGRAWNHEPALLFALLAFVAHLKALRQPPQCRWLILSGALLGLSLGTRFTFAPLVAPFGVALWLAGPPHWRPSLSFAAGLLLGCAGFLLTFSLAPEQTFFGTLDFARLNAIYRLHEPGVPRTMTLLSKLRFVWKEVARHDLPLLGATLLALLSAARLTPWRSWRFELRLSLLVMPFLLIGSLAPTPLFAQYFFPFVPFLILAGLYFSASIPRPTRGFPWALWAGLACVGFSAFRGSGTYLRIHAPFAIEHWTPMELHRRALTLRARVPAGSVITLGPILPLEAGLSIHAPFATGPFAWRVSSFLPPAKAGRLGMTTPSTLASTLDAAPPAALLLGFEPTEAALEAYATSRGYRCETLVGHTLWLPPETRASRQP